MPALHGHLKLAGDSYVPKGKMVQLLCSIGIVVLHLHW